MKRLLYISHRLPYPPDKGEKIRAFHEIVALAEHFEVTVAAVERHPADVAHADELRRWVANVLMAPRRKGSLWRGGWSLLRGRSLTEAYFHSRRLHRMIAAEHSARPFDAAVGYSSGMLPYLLALDAPIRVMDLVDADSAKWAAYAAASRRLVSLAYRCEAAGVKRLERRAIEACDAVVVVSDAEAEAIGSGHANLHIVANGVDTDYFTPDGESADLGPTALVFLGTMDYRPNVEAVCWFAENVWPHLYDAVEDASFVIVGRQPGPAVERLRQITGVVVTGDVEDVRPYLRGARAVVCPLRTARGIPNKILEAMAMAKPVIASSIALQGLDLHAGRDVVRADTAEQWLGECQRVLADPSSSAELGQAARQCVTTRYGWADRMQGLVDLCSGESGEAGE